MWANDDDLSKDRTGLGGGFDITGYDSPGGNATDTGKPSKGPSSVYPVTIKQILESPEEGITIGGNLVSMMTVVGIVKAIEITSTKVIYTVDDWTGSINGLQWLEGDEQEDENNTRVVEDTYCRMSGTKRVQEGKTCLFVYNIAPVENMMEITHHFLQVIYIPIKLEQLNQEQDKVPQPFMKMQMSTSYGEDMLGGSSAYSNLNLNAQQMRVYRVLQQCTSESGIDSKGIHAMMNVKMPVSEIDGVLDYLVSEGHIYATIDDYHFKATDLVS